MLRRQLDAVLLRFGQDLKHSGEYDEEAVQRADMVFCKLREKLKNFKISATFFAGSFGKKTDVLCPDLDLVLVVNFDSPEQFEGCRDKVLEQFHDILLLHQTELQILGDPVRGKNCIQFMFQNGVEVDLLVAGNLTKEEVYNTVARDPKKKAYLYGPCLTQLSLGFMRAQDSFAHSLVRVLRFWFKMLHMGDLNGGKLMIELIGVAAARKQLENKSILSGLSTALLWMSKLDSLKLAFVEEGGDWRQLSEVELLCVDELVRKRLGTHDILKRKRFVIDAANPFNDLLEDVDGATMRKLKKEASEMKDRLAKAVGGDPTYVKQVKDSMQFDIYKLFESDDANLWEPPLPFVEPAKATVAFEFPATSPNPDMKVRNSACLKREEVMLFIEAFKWELLARVSALQTLSNDGSSHNADTAEGVTAALEEMIAAGLKKKLRASSGSLGHNDPDHEGMDVTITVPYRFGNGLSSVSVKVSMSWN